MRRKHAMSGSVPTARRNAINAELERRIGAGPNTFSMPLEDRNGDILRYGTQWDMTSEEKEVLEEVLNRPANQGDVRENERINDHAKRLGLAKRKRKRTRP